MEKSQNEVPKGRMAKLKARLKFYGFVAMLAAMCVVFIWFLFKPAPQEEQGEGLNLSIPEASVQETNGNKLKVLEQAETQEKQSARIGSMLDFEEQPEPAAEFAAMTGAVASDIGYSRGTALRLNEQLRTFYDEPQSNHEMTELRQQMSELARMVQAGQAAPPPRPVDEMALLERSFEMASQYTGGRPKAAPITSREVVVVHGIRNGIVSTLAEAEQAGDGFVTAWGGEEVSMANAIRACVDRNQRVRAGSQVRLRLLEPMQAGTHLIPEGTPLFGMARIDGQRLSIVVTSIESAGSIILVELTVYDTDGQQGINVPDSMERTAAKESLAAVGQSVGSGMTLTRDARQQIAMDLTRGAMSGLSQYFGSKMREVKIHLKAGYNVFLIAKE